MIRRLRHPVGASKACDEAPGSHTRLVARTLVFAVALFACSGSSSEEDHAHHDHAEPSGEADVHTTTGEVRILEEATITIAHEEIPDFMPAMTMPFHVTEEANGEGLAVGDRVRFTLAPHEGGGFELREITKL